MIAVNRFARIRLAWLALIAAVVSLAGCAVPLGPGFHLRGETVTIHYARRPVVSAVYYHLQAEARNVGTRPLDSLRIRAPQQLALSRAEQASAGTSRISLTDGGFSIPLEPPLGQGPWRRITFGYQIPVRGRTVFLEPQDWFPSFLPPHGIFVKFVPRAPETEVAIYVPQGDRALTSGRLRRVRARTGRAGAATEYVFQIREKDFPPFLLIGDYDVQKVRAHGQSVFFWTNKPFPSACAQSVASEVVETTGLYRSYFGRLAENLGPLRMIEIPASTSKQVPVQPETIPNGVLFSRPSAEVCRNRGRFYFTLARALAATWFGWAVRPDPGEGVTLGIGIQDYAALLAAENRNGSGVRKRQVRDWLAEYDRLSSRAKPLAPANMDDRPTGDQGRLASVQSALFFVALEDRLGAETVRKALRDLVSSLDGSTAGRNELRSALERESGTNLYALFNQWLGRAGIPTSFRDRYSARKSASSLGNDATLPRSQEDK